METMTPDTTDIAPRSTAIVSRAQAIVVTDNLTLVSAEEAIVEIRKIRKEVANDFRGPIDKAHKAHKEMLTLRSKIDDPLKMAEGVLGSKTLAYRQEQERIRVAEERRLQAEARKIEEEKRLAEAERLEQEHRHEEAEQVVSAPVPTPVVVVPVTVAKTAGVSQRVNWRFKVLDKSLVPRQFMMLDEVKIGAHVRSMKEQANIPGIQPYDELSVSVRT